MARLHGLDPRHTVFAAQNPAAIDAGVFHNDVIAVGNGDVLFCHEAAFRDRASVLRELRRKYRGLGGGPLRVIEVSAREVPLATAISTYLFNGQLLTLPDGSLRLIVAIECERDTRTRRYLEALARREGITADFVDLRQSMRNGGGPACLRLRMVLTEAEWAAVPAGVKFDDRLYLRLKEWVEEHYRDRLVPSDLADPSLLEESRKAIGHLEGILGLAAMVRDAGARNEDSGAVPVGVGSAGIEALIRKAYAAFNARDIDGVLATLHPEVRWANGWEGGYVHGHAEVRHYWQRQWRELDPAVAPVGFRIRHDGRLEVEVRQVVKDLRGNTLFDGTVRHLYGFRDGRIGSMDIEKD